MPPVAQPFSRNLAPTMIDLTFEQPVKAVAQATFGNASNYAKNFMPTNRISGASLLPTGGQNFYGSQASFPQQAMHQLPHLQAYLMQQPHMQQQHFMHQLPHPQLVQQPHIQQQHFMHQLPHPQLRQQPHIQQQHFMHQLPHPQLMQQPHIQQQHFMHQLPHPQLMQQPHMQQQHFMHQLPPPQLMQQPHMPEHPIPQKNLQLAQSPYIPQPPQTPEPQIAQIPEQEETKGVQPSDFPSDIPQDEIDDFFTESSSLTGFESLSDPWANFEFLDDQELRNLF